MNNSNTPQPRMTGIDFHDVFSEHIKTEVRIFSYFAVLNISVGKQDITMFTKDAQEAYAIVRAIGNFTVINTTGEDVTEICDGEEPF